MKLRRVDPRKIRVPEIRVTARMDEETAEQFAASVKEVGIDEPIKCYEVDESPGMEIVGRDEGGAMTDLPHKTELWLSDGLHRLQEALKLNLPQVDVLVRPGTRVDVLCNNLMSGHLRGKHPVSEMVKVIEALYKGENIGIEEIVHRTGFTRDYVERLILISGLTPFCRAALDAGEIGVGHAFALTKLTDPVAQETVLGQQRLYRWPVKELEAYIKSVLEIMVHKETPAVTTEPPKPVKIKCFYCQGEVEPAMIANPNTCRECAAIMLTSIAEARRQAAQDKNSGGETTAVENHNPAG